MSTSETLSHRLAELGCERLPSGVIKVLRENVEQSLAKALVRIVEREVSAPKIARIFVKELAARPARIKGGVEGEIADVPFDQADLLILPPRNESMSVTGATTHNPDQP